jgi:hypothetical protein
MDTITTQCDESARSLFATSQQAGLPRTCIVEALPQETSRPELSQAVGTLLLRRIKYIARFIYWTALHRSTRHVAWVLAFEGFTW